MIFRLSQKASKKLRLRCERLDPSHASMLEWYCNLVVVERRQVFLFTQAATLFSFWCPAAGCRSDEFGAMFRHRASETLRDYGFGDGEISRVIDAGPDGYFTSVDRGVIGSMVDYVQMLQYTVRYRDGLERLGPREMNDIANECPMSRLAGNSPVRYLREVLQSKGAA